MIRQQGVPKEGCLYIGDSDVDVYRPQCRYPLPRGPVGIPEDTRSWHGPVPISSPAAPMDICRYL